MNIAVIGTGYVGLTQAVCLAHLGHNVIGVDIDEKKINALNNGESIIFEEGLPEMLKACQKKGNLSFTTNLHDAVLNSPEVIFVCVGTPEREDGSCDLRFVEMVLRDLSSVISLNTLITIKSTVPPGTSEQMHSWIGKNIELASNPEFLRQGTAIQDFLNPDRIVLGVESEESTNILKNVYKNIKAPVFVMSVESSQMVKYAANSMLALRLSFMNEIANIADVLGADVRDIENGIGSDPRIGSKFLRAGAGFGGSCFPKDVLALHRAGVEHGYDSHLIAPIIEVNNKQPLLFVKKALERLSGLEGKRIAVWGLAFNKGTDDVRESPAIKIVKELLRLGAHICAYDPEAIKNAALEFGDKIEYAKNKDEALLNANALFVLTEWPEFSKADWSLVKEHISIIFDGKNFLPHNDLRELGFEVHGMGLCQPKED